MPSNVNEQWRFNFPIVVLDAKERRIICEFTKSYFTTVTTSFLLVFHLFLKHLKKELRMN